LLAYVDAEGNGEEAFE